MACTAPPQAHAARSPMLRCAPPGWSLGSSDESSTTFRSPGGLTMWRCMMRSRLSRYCVCAREGEGGRGRWEGEGGRVGARAGGVHEQRGLLWPGGRGTLVGCTRAHTGKHARTNLVNGLQALLLLVQALCWDVCGEQPPQRMPLRSWRGDGGGGRGVGLWRVGGRGDEAAAWAAAAGRACCMALTRSRKNDSRCWSGHRRRMPSTRSESAAGSKPGSCNGGVRAQGEWGQSALGVHREVVQEGRSDEAGAPQQAGAPTNAPSEQGRPRTLMTRGAA